MSTPISATPQCPHFGSCGGCQYQDLAYAEQLRLKRARLEDLLKQAAIEAPRDIRLHSAEPYGYRNRIRLRVERDNQTRRTVETEGTAGQLRLGYNVRFTTEFLPIVTCPIAAPSLWDTAQSLLIAAARDRDAAFWLNAASEVELFCDQTTSRIQLTLHCAPRTKAQPSSFPRAFTAFQSHAPHGITIAGAAAIASDARTGPTGRTLAEAGATGLAYTVIVPNAHAAVSRETDETYWITRGGFFQVNRFLLETLVQLVCYEDDQPRSGDLAWDLYAGVGLFSRVLARSFVQASAVEANPTAAADLRSSLARLSPNSNTIEATTLDFLQRAVLQRDRPDLIILDPPRAGAGLEACALLNRIAAPTLIYVSCDPATLARDLQALQPNYRIAELHLVDLFPQTSHLETIAILERIPGSAPPPTMSN